MFSSFLTRLGSAISSAFGAKPHQADEYFRQKFRERLTLESHRVVFTARKIRHQHPDLSGPELVRLVYWGASGARA
jgi:hypothetical protein